MKSKSTRKKEIYETQFILNTLIQKLTNAKSLEIWNFYIFFHLINKKINKTPFNSEKIAECHWWIDKVS